MARKPDRLAILSHQELHRLASLLPFCFGETRENTRVFKIAPSPSTWCKVLQLQRGAARRWSPCALRLGLIY
jgi:hypothetical protein